MIPEYNKRNRALVDAFLDDAYFQKHVEDDLGAPVRVVVWWAQGFVKFEGRTSGKILKIQDILDGALALEAMRSDTVQ